MGLQIASSATRFPVKAANSKNDILFNLSDLEMHPVKKLHIPALKPKYQNVR
jgi:hypothetical protein